MSAKWLTAMSIAATSAVAVLVMATAPRPVLAADPVETGRFVWHDLMAQRCGCGAKVLRRVAGLALRGYQARGSSLRPRFLSRGPGCRHRGYQRHGQRRSAVAELHGRRRCQQVGCSGPIGRREGPRRTSRPGWHREGRRCRRPARGTPRAGATASQPSGPSAAEANHFFWQEYLARDAAQALDFYKRLAAYESAITDSRLGIEYHVLRKTRGRAGLFQLPATVVDVEPNWLPYVFVNDPATVAARVPGLGGRIVVAARPDLRNGSLVVIADPGGAVLALQKYPF